MHENAFNSSWVLIGLLFIAQVVVAQNDMSLVLLSEWVETGATCLDGSPVAYYLRRNTSSHQWVVFFHGGAWCDSIESCYLRSLTTLGSSTTYPPTATSGGIFSNNQYLNPDFYTWNAVSPMYCDGASWTGNADQPATYNNTQIYFRGKRNLDALISSLQQQGMSEASDVMIGGCSAGGLATYFHADYIASFFPNASTIKAMPVSGFFLNASSLYGQYVFGDQMAAVFNLHNSSGGVHAQCIANNQQHPQACFMAENTYPYIKTPIFPLNSLYDQYQLDCILTATMVGCNQVPGLAQCTSSPIYCNSSGANILNAYRTTFLSKFITAPTFGNPSNGYFLDSCIGHCEADPYDAPDPSNLHFGDWSFMTIDGIDSTEAVGNWYFNRSTRNGYIDCELNVHSPVACNPTCGQGST